MTALPGELLSGPEVGASDNTPYRQLPRSQPFLPDQAEGRFGAKTALTLDTLADKVALAQAPVLEGIAAVREILEALDARWAQVIAEWRAQP